MTDIAREATYGLVSINTSSALSLFACGVSNIMENDSSDIELTTYDMPASLRGMHIIIDDLRGYFLFDDLLQAYNDCRDMILGIITPGSIPTICETDRVHSSE